MTNYFRETFLFITVSVTINNNYVFVHFPAINTLLNFIQYLFDLQFYYHTDYQEPTIYIVSVDYSNYSDTVYNIMSCPHIYFFVPTTSSLFK